MSKKYKKRRDLPKYIEPSTEGKCPYCHKRVENIESHKKTKHKEELK